MTRNRTAPSPRGPSAGDAVGPYRLVRQIGEGGMGQVWAAEKDGAVVALKLLIGEDFTSERALLFNDEATAASALAHEAIVPTLDFGIDDRIHYLAMELVAGPSLKDLLDARRGERRPLPALVVAYIGVRIAAALHYAHTRAALGGRRLELVHRDVSPHNVLLDRSGGVFLSDFGVARTRVQVHRTTAGTVRGKPSYMAPEQVRGSEVDHRTDLFALGTCLYEAASVRRLFNGRRPADKMKAVLNVEPRPLPEIVPGFPRSLWKLIARALEKEPALRQPSAADLHQRLLAYVQVNGGVERARQALADVVSAYFPDVGFACPRPRPCAPRPAAPATRGELRLPAIDLERHRYRRPRSQLTDSELEDPTVRMPLPQKVVRVHEMVAFAVLLLACCSGVGLGILVG